MSILTIILMVVGVLTLYMRFRIHSELAIDRLLTLATIIILLHGIHFYLIFRYFTCCKYLEALAPYRLLYAPLIYFSIQSAQIPAITISKRQVRVHLFPISIFIVSYLFFSLSMEFRANYGELGFMSLLFAEVMSYLGYAVASIILIYKSNGNATWYPHMKVLAEIGVMLTILAGTYSLIQFFKESEHYISFIDRSYDFNLLFLLITMILLFMLTVEQLIVESNSSKGKNLSSKRNKMHSIIKNGNVSSEQKESNNILNNEDIEVIDFLQKLENLKAVNWFLDPEINLNSLARKTNTSTYFVSKVFNETLKVNFNQYINQLRVEYLVQYIKDQINEGSSIGSIEELYYQAGFKSKSTFNRHFKRTMNQTPTQFIDSLNKHV